MCACWGTWILHRGHGYGVWSVLYIEAQVGGVRMPLYCSSRVEEPEGSHSGREKEKIAHLIPSTQKAEYTQYYKAHQGVNPIQNSTRAQECCVLILSTEKERYVINSTKPRRTGYPSTIHHPRAHQPLRRQEMKQTKQLDLP